MQTVICVCFSYSSFYSCSIYSLLPCPSVLGFDELLTPEEKAKLYTAIGYSETAANPNLPKNVSHFPPNTHLSTNNTLPFGCLSHNITKIKMHMQYQVLTFGILLSFLCSLRTWRWISTWRGCPCPSKTTRTKMRSSGWLWERCTPHSHRDLEHKPSSLS